MEGNATEGFESLVVVTPYDPRFIHGHAADDLGLNALGELARHFRTTIIAPAPPADANRRPTPPDIDVEFINISRPTGAGWGRLLGVYPAGARKDWTSAMTRACLAEIARVAPDYVHIEYLQPLELALSLPPGRTTATFHDIGSVITKQLALAQRRPIRRAYRHVEHARVALLEKRLIRRLAGIACLSQRDAEMLNELGARAWFVPLGVAAQDVQWEPPVGAQTVVFAGALWREANFSTARWLIQEVMPRVHATHPNVVLRIIGEGAPSSLAKDVQQARNVSLIGPVSSFEEEYVRASVVLAPSMIDAGILLKALKAMAVGAPVVLNSRSAKPLGVLSGEHGLVADGADEYATAITRALDEHGLAERVAAAGRALVRERFTWPEYGRTMAAVIRCPSYASL